MECLDFFFLCEPYCYLFINFRWTKRYSGQSRTVSSKDFSGEREKALCVMNVRTCFIVLISYLENENIAKKINKKKFLFMRNAKSRQSIGQLESFTFCLFFVIDMQNLKVKQYVLS